MRKKWIYKTIIVCSLIGLLIGCKTPATTEITGNLGGLSDMEYLEEVIIKNPGIESFSSKLKLVVNLDGKQTSVNGNLKMKKDELIQVSIVPFLGIEVAKVDISPQGVLILDRMNKQYVQLGFDELAFLGKADLDFNVLQALFFNEIFLPGKPELAVKDLSSFTVKRRSEETLVGIKKSKMLNYNFTLLTDSGLLTDTDITHANYRLNWHYEEFKPVGAVNFPSIMQVEVLGTGKQLRAELTYSRMEADKSAPVPTEISEKYTKINTDELLKRLLSL